MLLRIAYDSQNYATIIGKFNLVLYQTIFIDVKLPIVLNSLAGCCIRVFHFNVTALLELNNSQ